MNVIPLFVNPRCADCHFWSEMETDGPFGWCEADEEMVETNWLCKKFTREKTAQPVEMLGKAYSEKV